MGKTALKISAILLLLLLVSAASAPAQDAADEKAAAAYGKIISVSRSMESLTCDFTETKHIAVLSSDVVSKGTLYYRSGCMRWEYDTENYGVYNNGRAYYVKEGKQSAGVSRAFAVIGKIAVSVIGGGELDRKRFSICPRTEGGELIVVLTPLQERIKAAFDSITIRFDTASGLIKSYETIRSGDSTKLVFSNIRINADLDPQLFD